MVKRMPFIIVFILFFFLSINCDFKPLDNPVNENLQKNSLNIKIHYEVAPEEQYSAQFSIIINNGMSRGITDIVTLEGSGIFELPLPELNIRNGDQLLVICKVWKDSKTNLKYTAERKLIVFGHSYFIFTIKDDTLGPV